ncbi:MAG: SLBB domain-containing protein [Pyrinomonadaceae bacterium]
MSVVCVFLKPSFFRNGVYAGLLAVLFAFARGIYSQAAVPAATNSDVSYLKRIHYGDLIDIHVIGSIEYDWRGRINPEGFIDGYDRIAKHIFARCRTEVEIAAEIDQELSKSLRDPKTEVRIVDISRRPVTILDGAVAVPTRFQIKRAVNLLELIVVAGGITERSNGTISIIRPADISCYGGQSSDGSVKTGVTKTYEIEISKILAGDAGANPLIVSGDLIVVAEASPIFLVGAVNKQGKFEYRPEITVSRAIANADGASKDAAVDEVKIFRRSPSGTEMIAVDLRKIASGEMPDNVLRPFDIIDVPYKGRPPRRLPPIVESNDDLTAERTRYPMQIID